MGEGLGTGRGGGEGAALPARRRAETCRVRRGWRDGVAIYFQKRLDICRAGSYYEDEREEIET